MGNALISVNSEELEILQVNNQLFKESLVGTIGALNAIKAMDNNNPETIASIEEELSQADKVMAIVNTLEIKFKKAENQLED